MCVCVCYAWARIIFFEEFGCRERERRERPTQKKRTKKKCHITQNVTRVIKNSPHNRNITHTHKKKKKKKKRSLEEILNHSLSVCVFLLLSLLFLRALSFCDSSLVRARAWVSFAIGIKYIFAGNFFFFSIFIPFSLSLSLSTDIKKEVLFFLLRERERETRELARPSSFLFLSRARVCEENS